MSTVNYPRAPITEAVIDIRVVNDPEITLGTLQGIREPIRELFPREQQLHEVTGEMEVTIGQSSSARAEQQTTGYRYISADGRYIWQCRFNGFTFSHLPPYDQWSTFRDAAKVAWEHYRAATMPQAIVRLAVRYINRIDIPHANADLGQYFRTLPAVSPTLRQPVAGFFLQLRMNHDDIHAKAVVNEAVVEAAGPETTSLILDVDLFRVRDVPNDEESLWRAFEDLHFRKNQIFESCITDSARELFR